MAKRKDSRSEEQKTAWVLYHELKWLHDRYSHWNEAPIPRISLALKRWEHLQTSDDLKRFS